MKMRYAPLATGCAVLALALGACTDTTHETAQIGDTKALLTNADYRVITDRAPAKLDTANPGRRVVCTEPPPDVAKALSTALSVTAKANVPSGAGGQLGIDSQTAEQLAELAGRVPGLLALRDGTFRECEAWANGALPDSSYALTVSRYGELLVTLMLGDDVSAAARTQPAKLTPVITPTPGGNNGSNTGTGTAVGGATPTASPTKTATAGTSPDSSIQVASLDLTGLSGTALASAIPAAAAPGAPAAPAAKPVAKPPTAPTTSPSGAAPAADTGTAAAADALQQMQSNYMKLSGVGPLIVACIAAGDPSRVIAEENKVLTTAICQKFLSDYAQALVDSMSTAGTAKATAQKIAQHK